MQRMQTVFAAGLAAAVLACGGGEKTAQQSTPSTPAAAPAAQAASAMTVPDWMKVDNAAKTVTMDVIAGKTADNNHWNFNGYYNGNATITVPVGYKITIKFTNSDPAMAHSVGVDSNTSNFPPMFTNPKPVFAGAITANPTDPTKGTQPNRSETITFTAATAGNYSLNCYMPGHAVAGMWIHFDVSAAGKAGVSTS